MNRMASQATILGRKIERAVYDPHHAQERFDPDFIVALHCLNCGRVGQARRADVRAANREHIERHHNADDGAVHIRVLYPKQ